MSDEILDNQKVDIRPLDCLSEGYQIIREQYWLFVGIVAVGTILGSIVPIVIMGPMMCGIFLCLLQRVDGKNVVFETLFKGFDYFVDSLIVTLIFTAAYIVIFVPAYIFLILGTLGMGAGAAAAGSRGPVFSSIFGSFFIFLLFFIFVMGLGLVLGVLFYFTYPLIVDRGMKAIPALKASFRAAAANFGGLFVLYLIGVILMTVASLFCYLPVYLVMPIFFGSIAVAYRRIFPGQTKMGEPDMSESTT